MNKLFDDHQEAFHGDRHSDGEPFLPAFSGGGPFDLIFFEEDDRGESLIECAHRVRAERLGVEDNRVDADRVAVVKASEGAFAIRHNEGAIPGVLKGLAERVLQRGVRLDDHDRP